MINITKHSGIYTLKVKQNLKMSLDDAWNYFSNPSNLSEITPTKMGFNITSEKSDFMYVGQIISYKVSPLLGLKMNWVTEITDKVSFKLPFGFLGRLFAPVIVIPQLKKIFNHRIEVLEKKFNNE